LLSGVRGERGSSDLAEATASADEVLGAGLFEDSEVALVRAWPDGLNSARAGRAKMSPAVSGPSAVMLPAPTDRTFPPTPKSESRLPSGSNAIAR
jgi:hypothetical protein